MQDYLSAVVDTYGLPHTHIPQNTPTNPTNLPAVNANPVGIAEIIDTLVTIGGKITVTKPFEMHVEVPDTAPRGLKSAILAQLTAIKPIFIRRKQVENCFRQIDYLKVNERSPTNPRPECLRRLRASIDELRKLDPGQEGYDDPSDPFAFEAYRIIDQAYYDLTRPGNPYPKKEVVI